MSALGVAIGFGAAFFLALSYVFSGLSVRRYESVGSVGLLCRAHIIMGGLAVCGLLFVYSPVVIKGLWGYLPVLTASVLFYLMGQTGLFMSQRDVDSSRVVPLLGLKLIILALVNMFLLPLFLCLPKESYNLYQWTGIAMTLGSAFLLNNAGGRIPMKSLCWILIACIGYALSDTCIKLLMNKVNELAVEVGDTALADQTRLSILCAMLSYIFSGCISVCILPFKRLPREVSPWGVWGWISPFALFWLTAMLFLFTCFNMIGTVNGNIVQSTRGLMAIILGWILSRMGFTELESRITAGIFCRRVIAGTLMIVAIVLFNWKA